MSSIHIKKIVRNIILILLIYQTSLILPAAAIGEASTSMYVFVPPGGSITASYLVITATQDNTQVNITDLDRTIGDPTNKSDFTNLTAYPIDNSSDHDLSEIVNLNKGQTRTIKVTYGEKGPDGDGAYFHIEANKPVITLTTTNQGYFQADFVPSISGTSKGREFFVYLPSEGKKKLNTSDEMSKGYDLAVFAYENDTQVSVYNISLDTTQMNKTTDDNLTTSVQLSYDNPVVDSVILNKIKPELFLEAAAGYGVHGGHTYWVVASRPVTVQSAGTIGHNTHEARDGGYFVPGYSANPYRDGTGLASTFLIQLNLFSRTSDSEGTYGETELYLINQNVINISNVSIYEWRNEWRNNNWEEIPESPFRVNASEMKIINEISADYFNDTGLVKIVSKDNNGNPLDISVFAASWLESSGSKTADISSFATGNTGYGGSRETIFYVPPPGGEPFYGNGSRYSHIFVYVHSNNTDIEVQAWNKSTKKWITLDEGIYNQLDENIVIDHRITWDQWNNSPNNIDYHRMRVLSSERTTIQINNWNDNWACYVPGGTPPEFSAKISVKSRYLIINYIPTPRIRYTFNISNMAIGDIGSDLLDLSVVNTIPDGIDHKNIDWSVSSNKNGSIYNSSIALSDLKIENGTYVWKNETNHIEVTACFYNDSSGMVFTFNRDFIRKDEILTFGVDAFLNTTYHNGTDIAAGPIVVDVSAKAENPFLGKVTANAKQPGTMILNYLIPGKMQLY